MGSGAPSPHHCYSTSRTGGCGGILFHPQPKRVQLSTIGLGAGRSRTAKRAAEHINQSLTISRYGWKIISVN
jgi:hypothetical protein